MSAAMDFDRSRASRKSSGGDDPQLDGPQSGQGSAGAQAADYGRILRQGASGAQVLELQRLLEKAGHDVGVPDGDFGGATKYAVMQFQRRHRLAPDGDVGPQTWTKLRAATGATPKPSERTGPATATTPDANANANDAAGDKEEDKAKSAFPAGTVLRKGDRGDLVKQLQTLLGLPAADRDGVFGDGTHAAVMAFQTSRKLGADGVAGETTLAALQSWRVVADALEASLRSGKIYQKGDQGPAVKEIQRMLGMGDGGQTGVYGPTTEAEVKKFQKTAGIVQNGLVGSMTYAALKKADQAGGPVPGLGRSKSVTGYRNGKSFSATVYDVGQGEYLQKDAAQAMMKMKAAAQKAGIALTFNSGFRSNAEQQALWRRYGAGRAAQPGYSNHQQGLSMDINVVDGKILSWLRKNAGTYGFVNDVGHEPWHWTYYG